MKHTFALLCLIATTTFSSPFFSGFIGDGERAFAQKFGFRLYGLDGNQNDDANPTTVHSLMRANDPPPGKSVIRKVAQLGNRKDGLGYSAVHYCPKCFDFFCPRFGL